MFLAHARMNETDMGLGLYFGICNGSSGRTKRNSRPAPLRPRARAGKLIPFAQDLPKDENKILRFQVA